MDYRNRAADGRVPSFCPAIGHPHPTIERRQRRRDKRRPAAIACVTLTAGLILACTSESAQEPDPDDGGAPVSSQAFIAEDFTAYASTDEWRAECESRGSQCLGLSSQFLDDSAIRFDWTDQACKSQSRGFPYWFSSERQDELWIEVRFKLSENYTSCNDACAPCDHKLLFGFSGEGHGRWEVKLGGGGSSSNARVHTGVGGWLNASNMDKPADFSAGFSVSDYTDERWHTLRVHWKHSSTETSSDGIGEIWIDGVKGNSMLDINTASGASFQAIFWGRNKDKGRDSGTESIWIDHIQAWDSDPGW